MATMNIGWGSLHVPRVMFLENLLINHFTSEMCKDLSAKVFIFIFLLSISS